MPQTTGGEPTIPVRLAAFGTLSNGSDVRLLASPKGEALTREARGSIERFFYKAWRGSRRRTAPYFAFLPLDHDPSGQAAHWGLIRVTHLGTASMGAVIVVWVAVLATEDLDRIDWQTHRLWSTALPEARLPDAGEQTAPGTCSLGPEWNTSLDPYLESFERAAYALCGGAGAPRQVSVDLVVEPPASGHQQPLTPEGALFGVWNRLGRWCADLSYCTWGDIDGDEPAGDDNMAIDVRVGRTGPATPGRVVVRLGRTLDAGRLAEPAPAWLLLRQIETGVRPVSEILGLLEGRVDEVASALFHHFEDAFRQSTFTPFQRFLDFTADQSAPTPGQMRVFQGFVPKVLDLALDRLEDPARLGIFEYYLTAVAPRLKASAADTDPLRTAARMAIEHGVIHRFSNASLDALAPALSGGRTGSTDLLEAAMERVRQAPAAEVNWSGWLGLVLTETERATEPQVLDEALVDLVAGGWGFPSHRDLVEEGLAQFIDRHDPVAALAMIGAAPRSDRRGLFAGIASRRVRNGMSRRRRDPANPASLVVALRLLDAGMRIERDQRGVAP